MSSKQSTKYPEKRVIHAADIIQPQSDLLTVHEVAQMLRVDDTTVRRWVRDGALKAVILPHVGGRKILRIHRATIDTVLGGGK